MKELNWLLQLKEDNENNRMRIILKLKLHSPLVGTNQTELSIVFHYYDSLIRWLKHNKASTQIERILSIDEY